MGSSSESAHDQSWLQFRLIGVVVYYAFLYLSHSFFLLSLESLVFRFSGKREGKWVGFYLLCFFLFWGFQVVIWLFIGDDGMRRDLFECGWCILIFFFLYCIFFLLWSSNTLYLCSICSNKIPLLYLYNFWNTICELCWTMDSASIFVSLFIIHFKRKQKRPNRKISCNCMWTLKICWQMWWEGLWWAVAWKIPLGRFVIVMMMMMKGMLWDLCHNILVIGIWRGEDASLNWI